MRVTYPRVQSGLLEGIDALTDETDIALKARVAVCKPILQYLASPPIHFAGAGDTDLNFVQLTEREEQLINTYPKKDCPCAALLSDHHKSHCPESSYIELTMQVQRRSQDRQ